MAKFFSIKSDGARSALIAQNEERNANIHAVHGPAPAEVMRTYLLTLAGG